MSKLFQSFLRKKQKNQKKKSRIQLGFVEKRGRERENERKRNLEKKCDETSRGKKRKKKLLTD